MSTRTRRCCGVAFGVAALAVAGAAPLPDLHAAEAAPVDTTAFSATTMNLPSGAKVEPASTSTGEQAVFYKNGAASKDVTTSGPWQEVAVSAKTSVCGSQTARFGIRVDGNLVFRSLTTDKWLTYKKPLALPAGRHDIQLVFENELTRKRCTRALHLDTVTITSAGTAPEPTPTTPTTGMGLLKEDTMAESDPLPLWGAIDCASPTRVELFGSTQPSYRRISVLDGDDFFNERCELGELDRDLPTFMRYFEGDRKLTLLKYRMPSDFPIDATGHQALLQMKRVGGSSVKNPPILSLQANKGKLWLKHNQNRNSVELWSAQVELGQWFSVAFDVTYSQDPSKARIVPWINFGSGWVEQTAITGYATLDKETQSGYRDPVGASVPGHLRVGVYHDPAIVGTHVDLGSAQVWNK